MSRATGDGNGAAASSAQAVQPVQPSEGPELVQLLTPEGERVPHPDYSLELADEEYRELYRDLVMVRRIDTEAMALQRQGGVGSGPACSGRRPRRSVPGVRSRSGTLPSRPTASTASPTAR